MLGRNNNRAVEEGGDVRERSDNTGVVIEKDSPCPLLPSLHGALLGFNLLGDWLTMQLGYLHWAG